MEVKPPQTILERCIINPYKYFEQREYIAVSYVWRADPEEQNTYGRYLIKSRVGDLLVQSPVRDVVLDRVMNYARYFGCRALWIDRICIDQDDEKERSIAVQAMDLVYSLSRKSVAVINQHIKTRREMEVLSCVMRGGYLGSENNALETLKMVNYLTSATWWKKA